MKASHALTYLRQLCCSGLSKEVVITEFLKSLPMFIPSNSNTFSIGDMGLVPNYHLSGFDISDMVNIAPNIIAEYHTSERQQRAATWFASHPTIHDPRVMEKSFYMTDLYNLIYRRYDMHHVLWVPVPLDGVSAGVLGLYRTPGQKPFDNKDQMQIMPLLRYLAHAYRAANYTPCEVAPNSASGMLIFNVNGTIQYQSPEARLLLEQARFPRVQIDLRQQDRLLAKLAELCGNLQRIFRGHDAPPPSHIHNGPNGQFVFRAYWLNGGESGPQNLIGMTVEHRQPLLLKILQAMRDMPLTPMQKEVGVLLAQGVPFEQIGKRLSIKYTTVKDHVGKIYDKLEIRQRDELLPKLLAEHR
ncbi:helix-turn-helix transcriptional regulator [Methylomonas sp. TEB]|uniref:helix-turn-helix transcriptional regulator n=1 Tax=Methylomonas sp. TEB TaxID=3398229 RepID=UPI0039F5BB8E